MTRPLPGPAALGLAGLWWPRRLSWSGTLPLAAVAKRRPGNHHLPGRQPDPIPGLYPDPDQALLERVLRGLRAL
ncbi:hypothetical protein [Actinopolyspora mortivallis]|uniref:hypothetical protein n=1 Tax=Actinopolyspora mortivallis TaxID=33906 RepID=UPI0011B29E4F|nr:hypothetical protein [Actinopolyspora mortivallis]